jgi:uncharacterized repeat protein (TIGR03803 family)
MLSVKGNDYGATLYGGPHGFGTIWKLTKKSTFTMLHGFTMTGGDGGYPNGGLVEDQKGNLYGTTSEGGTGTCMCGTVFKMTPDGKSYTTLYSFTAGTDGAFPLGPLVRDKAGNLYGTASEALGSYGCDTHSCGTVWQLTPDGTFTILHTFTSGNDGANPQGNLLMIGKTLYGTTQWGGSNGCSSTGGSGCGTVYKLVAKPHGKYTVLHQFADGTDDGQHPLAGLAQGPDKKLYGTTSKGGSKDGGILFSVTTK